MNETYWGNLLSGKPLRILCVRPDNFGDVLMTTPAFRALKETYPNCHLTLLTSPVGAAVAGMIPEIDDVITVDVPWVRSEQTDHDPANVVTMAEELRQQRFDAAILFTVQSQNPLPAAMLCYLAGIPRVLGYCRENPYRLITDWIPDPEVLVATRHEVNRQLDLVAAIGCYTNDTHLSLQIPAEAHEKAIDLLKETGVSPNRPWLILHPGVSEEKRRYPADCYVKAANRLADIHDYQIILTGSASEWAYVDGICQQIGPDAFNLAGMMDLATLAALIAEAPVLIANNTGPVHLAAAIGTPVVVLYAKTNPQHTPWQVPGRVLYFDVPEALRSKNVLLQQFPEPAEPVASPEAIVRAVRELAPQPVNVLSKLVSYANRLLNA
ncbi:glycosyl transferase family 9 [Fibrisoma limi BUZ 3]|uniref:Glycosyl transferase family 9 n=1 Tax=Fibrisoma limi BUZ 3 TaxID=1185876 RepID=I2GCU9_9BACT|nr:glycosyltransferase family 9 protein [Fibrisoma limi]CCH51723.1 glycosyl transferase family 9 [Fibrisoma limi BUZ 3]